MALTIAHISDDYSIYLANLKSAIAAINADLLQTNIWTNAYVAKIPQFNNEYIGPNTPIIFDHPSELVNLELKLYWSKILMNKRCNSMSIIERRRLPMKWLTSNWDLISAQLGHVQSIAEIPHPAFPPDGFTSSSAKKQQNELLLTLFGNYLPNQKRPSKQAQWVKEDTLREKHYASPRISIIGDFHKQILINKEQLRPLAKRNIIYLNDLYSEEDTRFKAVQKESDWFLNLYLYPIWLREAIRVHIFSKIENGEIGPQTMKVYFGRLINFRDFMHETFKEPSPKLITNILISENFIAWGNENNLSGKNWFTDAVAMLATAASHLPDQWPSLSINPRVARKIKRSHYKEGLGRIGYCKEGAGRSYSQRIIDELRLVIEHAPHPILNIFTMILSTGMRSEDGHSVLFDCLKEDPNDSNFMLLTFWQNKVRAWNVKPLLKSDQGHLFLINSILNQQENIIKKYGHKTHYLFPTFTGSQESFTGKEWTMQIIRKLCVEHGVKDDKGNVLNFSWHPLRHTKGTSLAKEGHDVLTIMMELGHSSPDMATVYVNNRLELKKQALMDKGAGRFFTIEGQFDHKVGELIYRKDLLIATRVCGGACAMPSQIGDWCEHANACYTCKYFRADEKDIEFFRSEQAMLDQLINEQSSESKEFAETGKTRLSEITFKRLQKNKEVYVSLGNIISAIETTHKYSGGESKFRKVDLESTK